MGNVSTSLLEFGDAEKVSRNTARLIRDGIDIISPACGLSTSTGAPQHPRPHRNRERECVMAQVYFRSHDIRIEVEPGTSLLDAARRGRIRLEAPCNGAGTCGKCKVRLDDETPATMPASSTAVS